MQAKKLTSLATGKFKNVINQKAFDMFGIMMRNGVRAASIPFKGLAEEIGVPEGDPLLDEYVTQFASVSVLADVMERSELVQITFPLFSMSKVDVKKKMLSVELNPSLLKRVGGPGNRPIKSRKH